MNIELTAHEARIIGCLMEKEVTTPEQYPLSLNALTNACNQKSNRDPVLNLTETTVQQVLDGLLKRHLVSDRSGYGGRVTKYKQVLCNMEFGPLQFTAIERAIICELLVRGPQTPGELRTRCNRMAPIAEVSEEKIVSSAVARRFHRLRPARPRMVPGAAHARLLPGGGVQLAETHAPVEMRCQPRSWLTKTMALPTAWHSPINRSRKSRRASASSAEVGSSR